MFARECGIIKGCARHCQLIMWTPRIGMKLSKVRSSLLVVNRLRA
jgi:hypothetical protein